MSCTLKLAAGFLAVLMVWSVPQARATADGPDYYRVRDVESWDVLNMREKPDPGSAIVGTIPHDGRCVRNLGQSAQYKQSTWVRVEYGSAVGWVNSRFLGEGGYEGCVEPAPPAPAEPAAEPASAEPATEPALEANHTQAEPETSSQGESYLLNTFFRKNRPTNQKSSK